MHDLVLYNYDLSPFSEKIRTMLGHTDLTWRSVKVAEAPPRPVLEILAGGYRKIPVAQTGADIYCDTRTITGLIAQLSGRPELCADHGSDDIQAFVHRADHDVFIAALLAYAGPGMLGQLFKATSLRRTFKFLIDRVRLGTNVDVDLMTRPQAREKMAEHVAQMDSALQSSRYLFGSQPTEADFSAYHVLWFLDRFGPGGHLDGAPRVREWMSRIEATGHGNMRACSEADALDVARNAEPKPLLPNVRLATPRRVAIAPSDYARDPVIGLLVAESGHDWTLAHHHDRVGTVHIHLPKLGFGVENADG